MNPIEVTGFENYTPEILYELRGLFASEIIDSRPIKWNNVIVWLDAKERIHRSGFPAVERRDGSCEFWEKGIKR